MCEQKEECWGEHSALRDADIYSYSEGCGSASALSVIIEHKSAIRRNDGKIICC